MPIGNPISLTRNVATREITVSATVNQTLFTIDGGYRINKIDVFRNGVKLNATDDFIAADGSTVTLATPAYADDEIVFRIFDDFRVADAIVSAASSQTVNGNLRVTGDLFVAKFAGSVGIDTDEPTSELHVSGVGSTDNIGIQTYSLMVPNGAPQVRVGSHHWDRIYSNMHLKDVTSEIWVEQNSDNDDGADLVLYKSRGVPGAETPVVLGDNLGRVNVRGFSTTATTSGAAITATDYAGTAGGLEWNVDFLGTRNNGRGYAGASLNIRGRDITRLTVASGGKVGIGTTIPKKLLHLQSGNPTLLFSASTKPENNRHWQITPGADYKLRIQGLTDALAGGTRYFEFFRDGSHIDEFRGVRSGDTWFVIDNDNAKVGIGSTVPVHKLDVKGDISVDGDIQLSSHLDMPDSAEIRLGTGDDLNISHNGSASNISQTGTGPLQIRNEVAGQDVVIQADNGAGGTAQYFRADGSDGGAKLYHYGLQKLNTKSDGVDVTGEVQCDSLDVDGDISISPGSSVTPQNNGDVVVEATNDTTLTFKLKGSDGVVRSGTLTLS